MTRLPSIVVCLFLLIGSCAPQKSEISVSTPEIKTFIKGVTVADDFPDYTSTEAQVLYDSLIKAGATWVAITPCGYVDSSTSTIIQWTNWAKRDYTNAIKLAQSKGLKVLFKPYIFSSDFYTHKRWTGSIEFPDSTHRANWFASYTTWLLDCAHYAQSGGASVFCVGLELPKLSLYTDEWISLIRKIRAVYKGKLTYAAHGTEEADNIHFWHLLDYIGVNVYPTLDTVANANIKQLEKGWLPVATRCEKLSHQHKKQVLFTEVGFRSVEKTYEAPWQWPEHVYRKPNTKDQFNAYVATVRATFNKPWLGGVFWWKVFTNPYLGNEGADGFSPQNKPAWKVLFSDTAAYSALE